MSLMSFGGGLLISIRANQIYYEKLGKVEGFENFLLMITKASMCNYLPDVDIVWKMEDHCGNITAKEGSTLPIFSCNKRVTEQCVLFPWVQFLWPHPPGETDSVKLYKNTLQTCASTVLFLCCGCCFIDGERIVTILQPPHAC